MFVGIGETIAGIAVLATFAYARRLAIASGIGLCTWIVVQLAWLRMVHPVMQPAIFAAGIAIWLLARGLPREASV